MEEVKDVHTKSSLINVEEIMLAHQRVKDVVTETPLQKNYSLSDKYGCNVLLKREDMQVVRSFKIRGAYNKMKKLSLEEQSRGVICASAGNHAQGFAMSCSLLKIHGTIFMPSPTPKQKVDKVNLFGGEWVKIVMEGDTFDDAYHSAIQEVEKSNAIFIHPFDDLDVIAGQGTVATEILAQSQSPIDYLFVAVGGGGLISGVGSYFKALSPNTKIIAIETTGAPALHNSLQADKVINLETIDTFADGIAVKSVGKLTFKIAKEIVDDSLLVPEGAICSTILKMYNDEAIVVEPAGAVSISALEQYKDEIKGKTVCIIVCGGNNDITRTAEIRERALLYEGKKHYFIIRFPQRAGALKEFLGVLGPNDDITHFEYTKKNNRESGPALVGIELKEKKDYHSLIAGMESSDIKFEAINHKPLLFDMLV